MALTFKKFAQAFAYAPGTAASGISDLLFGATEKDSEGKTKEYEGILGTALNALKFVAKGFSNFIREHKQAIAVAFWVSLVLGAAVGLGLFLAPASFLATIASFSVFGLSIEGIVGANALAQIGFAAGLAATLGSVGTYLGAAAVNTVSAIKNYFAPATPAVTEDSPEATVDVTPDSTATMTAGLNVNAEQVKTSSKETNQTKPVEPIPGDATPPAQHTSPLASPKSSPKSSNEVKKDEPEIVDPTVAPKV